MLHISQEKKHLVKSIGKFSEVEQRLGALPQPRFPSLARSTQKSRVKACEEHRYSA
jgi:hypothetical protein